jgi:branched-chain amino acid aminotransferase
VVGLSKTWTYFEDNWHESNAPIMGPRTHAAWICSLVFGGVRAFEGVTPDIELYCTRVICAALSVLAVGDS